MISSSQSGARLLSPLRGSVYGGVDVGVDVSDIIGGVGIVGVSVSVRGEVGVPVGVEVSVPVGVEVSVPVGVVVSVTVGVAVNVPVGVEVSVPVAVGVAVVVGVGVSVMSNASTDDPASLPVPLKLSVPNASKTTIAR